MGTIYGIMITGKSDKRMPLAIMATNNFFEQNYNNKILIVINTSNIKITDSVKNDNIKEYFVNQTKDIKLGDLRNIGLSKLNIGNIWVQWDDDDIKHPDYLKEQHKVLIEKKADVVILSGQLRFSTKKNTIWYIFDSNIDGSIMMYYDSKYKYKSEATGEDSTFLNELVNANKKIYYCDSIFHYLRIINDNNTWDDNHFGLNNIPENFLLLPYENKSEKYNINLFNFILFYNRKINEYLSNV